MEPNPTSLECPDSTVHRLYQHVAITGYKGSGKDTIADYLIETRGYVKQSFATPLKLCMAILFGFSVEQLYDAKLKEEVDPRWGFSPREAMQKYGSEVMRDELPKHLPLENGSIWCQAFQSWFHEATKANPNLRIVVPDLRFENEEKLLRSLGFLIVRAVRLNDSDASDKHTGHQSETNIDKICCDLALANPGNYLETLYENIEVSLCVKLVSCTSIADETEARMRLYARKNDKKEWLRRETEQFINSMLLCCRSSNNS